METKKQTEEEKKTTVFSINIYERPETVRKEKHTQNHEYYTN
jgi:hypothetical protein